jgi:IclR family pca regulon transcriptional regulator
MTNPPSMRSLERGLLVIKHFAELDSAASISELARLSGLDRAVVRRVLGTLEQVGYVSKDGDAYRLRPSVLELGYAYLSSNPLPKIAAAHLGPFAESVQESCSFGVMDGKFVRYVSRKEIKRISGPSLAIGAVAEPHLTSIGRVLLANLPEADVDLLLNSADFRQITVHTLTSRSALDAELVRVREQGWCLIDQEVELGLLALAVPVKSQAGRVVAAVNVITHTSRYKVDDFCANMLPELKRLAQSIEQDLAKALVP